MANPMYGSNRDDGFLNQSCVVMESKALSAANQQYVTFPWRCKVVKIYYAVNVALTTAKSTITLKAGTGSMAGTHEIAHEAAIGTVGSFSPTSNQIIEAGAALEIENDASPGAGQVVWSIIVEAA